MRLWMSMSSRGNIYGRNDHLSAATSTARTFERSRETLRYASRPSAICSWLLEPSLARYLLLEARFIFECQFNWKFRVKLDLHLEIGIWLTALPKCTIYVRFMFIHQKEGSFRTAVFSGLFQAKSTIQDFSFYVTFNSIL